MSWNVKCVEKHSSVIESHWTRSQHEATALNGWFHYQKKKQKNKKAKWKLIGQILRKKSNMPTIVAMKFSKYFSCKSNLFVHYWSKILFQCNPIIIISKYISILKSFSMYFYSEIPLPWISIIERNANAFLK